MRQGLTAWREIAALGPLAELGLLTGLGLLAGLAPARAADLYAPMPYSGGAGAPSREGAPPRYFPRADENGDLHRRAPVLRRQAARCRVWRVPVPTNAPDDPSYVGSAYGLGKPSTSGFTPPLGVDDPYGRPLLPYCP